MLAIPVDRVAYPPGYQLEASLCRSWPGYRRSLRIAFLPLSAALSRSLHGRGLGEVSHSGGHSVVRGKKKPVHRHTNPNGSFPLAGVLVWLSMYRLKSRIQLAHQCGLLS